MDDKITYMNSHGLIDPAKKRKEWLDELALKEQHFSSEDSPSRVTPITAEQFGRLISMARQGINYKTIEMVDGWTIEDLVAKVERYEKALIEIQEELHHKKWGVDRNGLIELIVTRALDEDKE